MEGRAPLSFVADVTVACTVENNSASKAELCFLKFYMQEANGQQYRKKHKCVKGAKESREETAGVSERGQWRQADTFKDRCKATTFQ